MNLHIQNRLNNLSPLKIALLSIALFLGISGIISTQIALSILLSTNIHKGVYINNIDIGSQTKSEALKKVTAGLNDEISTKIISIKASDYSKNISYKDLNVVYNINNTIDRAYKIGREGSFFTNLYDIYTTRINHVNIDLDFSINNNRLDELSDIIYNKSLLPFKNPSYIVKNDALILDSGHAGKNITKSSVSYEVKKFIKENKDGVIQLSVITKNIIPLDSNEILLKINLNVKNASVSVVNNTININPQVIGRNIDKEELIKALSSIENKPDTEKSVKITIIEPKVTSDTIRKNLFKDRLSIFSTQFYTSNQNDYNRGVNIKLGSSKISGTVLAVGQVFSFNDTVGPRSKDKGYRVAHAYIGGSIVDSEGGGVCQISTTLYNTVLLADLPIVERSNHMFTVGYVPYGMDAAVSYDKPDLKFKNSTNWPIKINSWVTDDNRLFFEIWGTNENPGKTVDFRQEITETIPPETRYTYDPYLEQGELIVTRYGMNGYAVNTFKIVRQNGTVISNTEMYTSRYNALSKEVTKGIKKNEPPIPVIAITPNITLSPNVTLTYNPNS